MAEAVEARIIRYRETATALRRQAEQLPPHNATIKQLHALADGWDQLAVSVEIEQGRLR